MKLKLKPHRGLTKAEALRLIAWLENDLKETHRKNMYGRPK